MSKFPDISLSVITPEFDKDVAVIDLDNCISDDKWRWPLFDLHRPIVNERYSRYHDACESDGHENGHVIRELSAKYPLIVFTSRPESVRFKTMRWLNRWRVPVIGLYMRPNDNHESSVPLKQSMLRALPMNLRVRYAIDDRVDILDMYADEGVNNCRRIFINATEVVHP